jgi:hypothetical protein
VFASLGEDDVQAVGTSAEAEDGVDHQRGGLCKIRLDERRREKRQGEPNGRTKGDITRKIVMPEWKRDRLPCPMAMSPLMSRE